MPSIPQGIQCMPTDGVQMKGREKYFSRERGYGKIIGEDGQLYFVHYKKIRGWPAERVTLEEGQRVSFEPGENDRGGVALNVERE